MPGTNGGKKTLKLFLIFPKQISEDVSSKKSI